MDTLLENMDHAAGPDGAPVTVTGLGALLQRLLIRLSVREGAFPPDRALGSRLYKLPAAPGEDRDRLAFHYARQALLPEEGVAVTAARCRDDGPDCLRVAVDIRVSGKDYPLEVCV